MPYFLLDKQSNGSEHQKVPQSTLTSVVRRMHQRCAFAATVVEDQTPESSVVSPQ